MLSFANFLTEKLDAVVRLPSDGHGSYQPAASFFTRPVTQDAEIRNVVQALAYELESGLVTRPASTTMLPASVLIPTQPTVDADQIAKFTVSAPSEPVVVYRLNGKFYIVNGHHRVAAAIQSHRPIRAAVLFP